MKNPKEILKKYWGYDDFREFQEDIINSILQKKDTLALLPTGGGKSVCFQVPALCLEGVCLVISPLISLMKDQIQNLEKIGIESFYTASDIDKNFLYSTLKKIAEGKSDIKFIYVSPEKLKSKTFLEYLKNINISIIAVDEAHCISQWGHDFRPEYMQVSKIREVIRAPVLALTASATPDVIEEIQKNLGFKRENVFKKSFERKNLSYIVLKKEHKLNTLVNVLKKIEGSTIIYVRSRKKTREISDYLQKNGFSSDYYHAGLSSLMREIKQKKWKDETTTIIVATSAFGMGIDKHNVRLVLHIDFADSIEAYFQEAGRAGRDGNEAKCITILNENDISLFRKRLESNKVDLDYLKKTFEYLNNFFKNYQDENINRSFVFDISEFLKKYKLNVYKTLRCLELLAQEEIIEISNHENIVSKISIISSSEQIINYKNLELKSILDFLLRNYPSIIGNEIKIEEEIIAKNFNISLQKTFDYLDRLKKLNFISYKKRDTSQSIIFLTPNDSRVINRSKEKLDLYNKRIYFRGMSIFRYITEDICRNVYLLSYFGEKNVRECGKCDICIKNKKELKEYISELENEIAGILKTRNMSSKEICSVLKKYEDEDVLNALRDMLENKKIEYVFFDKIKLL